MTHASNIVIPARFTFKPYRAKWVTCWAEIVDWAERPQVFPDIAISLAIPPMAKSLLGQPLNVEDTVKVQIEVPSPEQTEQSAFGLYLFAPSYIVEVNRTDIPADVLSPDENPKNTPDIAGRRFPILACPIKEAETLFYALRPRGTAADAWKMRDEFFNLGKEVWEMALFFSRWGFWTQDRGYRAGIAATPHGFILTFPHLVWEQRDRYRSALAGRASKWLGTARPLDFTRMEEPPYFLVDRSYCADAIEATITIDHLADLKFGICKRNDCKKLYERTTKQKRLYCSPHCAHLANVRKLRAEKRKAESKGRKHATRKTQGS